MRVVSLHGEATIYSSVCQVNYYLLYQADKDKQPDTKTYIYFLLLDKHGVAIIEILSVACQTVTFGWNICVGVA